MPDRLTIRAATPLDVETVRRLSRLDRRTRPRGDALLAERDGVAVAAITLASGSVLADPLQPTTDAVRLLRARRYRLLRQGGDVGHLRSLLRRLAPQPATQGA